MPNPIDTGVSQLRFNKIISSGSTGVNAKIVVYDVAAASDTSGTINSSLFNTSSIGTDVYFYMSGSISSRNSGNSFGTFTVGGDTVVSGNLYGLRTITSYGGFSGSLTKLTDGSSFLVAGTNMTVVSNSNGSITISSTGLSDGQYISQSGTTPMSATWGYGPQAITFYEITGTMATPGVNSGSFFFQSNGLSSPDRRTQCCIKWFDGSTTVIAESPAS